MYGQNAQKDATYHRPKNCQWSGYRPGTCWTPPERGKELQSSYANEFNPKNSSVSMAVGRHLVYTNIKCMSPQVPCFMTTRPEWSQIHILVTYFRCNPCLGKQTFKLGRIRSIHPYTIILDNHRRNLHVIAIFIFPENIWNLDVFVLLGKKLSLENVTLSSFSSL